MVSPHSRRRAKKKFSSEDNRHKPADVVDLCDSDEEPVNGNHATIGDDKESDGEKYEDEDVEVNTTSTSLPGHKKRKLVITSDDEDEDNIPISKLNNLKPRNQDMSDLVDTEEESEGESLDGFIVDDEIETNETGGDESDVDIGYADILSRLRRDKKPGKMKWESVGDLQAEFGKNDELCMKAVCVLYRFQTEDEKVTRSSHVSNGRGFSQYDAVRGTWIGQFLTDGDHMGDLKKSVEELKEIDSEAVETCRDLAMKYSVQLFKIYNNREDPFFAAPPSP